jgi:tetratricopeptide (TPR) repeat protein
MKTWLVILAVASTVIIVAGVVSAHEDGTEKLGKVHFPTSCNAAAQAEFERAVALLHSFWYEEALKAFTSVTSTDPRCAMGYWGIAMSVYYPLWFPPSEVMLKRGSAAIQTAKTLGGTSREQGYVGAIETFYKDADKIDHRTRAVAYEKAMERLSVTYPDDREAAIFYALALDATAPPTDKTHANQLKAAVILERVFSEQPNHPGVAHYLIHSYDVAPLATRGLPAARSYSKIAPSAPHALHMPSHIFTRLGLWEESIESNLASAQAGREYVARSGGQGLWDQTLHALDYLAYGYLQGGQDRAAKRVADEITEMRRAEPESLAAAYAIAAIPARYVLERQRWTEAASLAMHPMPFPWNRYAWGEAMTVFTRAVGAARSGDTVAARKEVDRLQALREALVQTKNTYWADQVEVQRRAAAAWTAKADRKPDEALKLMRAAADLEGTMDKHPVTPGPLVPAREMLGELLLDLGQPAQALAEFETSIANEPNRFRGFYGAARAAELTGDAAKARVYYTKLVALCDKADTPRPELGEAKAFLMKAR